MLCGHDHKTKIISLQHKNNTMAKYYLVEILNFTQKYQNRKKFVNLKYVLIVVFGCRRKF